MPKPHSLPTLFNEVKTLSIKKFREWGNLAPNKITNSTIEWTRNGVVNSSISIHIDTHNSKPFVEVSYTWQEQKIKYSFRLVSVESNLGKGSVWYFECPRTYKLCRKLYLVEGYFYHRSAFRGCMYESQTYSKRFRKYVPYLSAMYSDEHPYKKHFKKFYKGQPTKRYLKCLEIERMANVYSEEFLMML